MDLILDEQRLATVLEEDIKDYFTELISLKDCYENGIADITLEEAQTKCWNMVRTWIDFETDYDIGREYDNKDEFEKWLDSVVAHCYIEELKKNTSIITLQNKKNIV